MNRYLRNGLAIKQGQIATGIALTSISIAFLQLTTSMFQFFWSPANTLSSTTLQGLSSAAVWTVTSSLFVASVLLIGWYIDKPEILQETEISRVN